MIPDRCLCWCFENKPSDYSDVGKRRSTNGLEFSTAFIALLFALELIDLLTPLPLDALGILPRTGRGLLGVVFSPLLHANFAHVIANAFPLWILLLLLYGDRRYKPPETLATIWIGSGIGTWLIGRGGAVHVGASSLVFGLVTYLIVSGVLMKRWRPALIAFLVLIVFGGIFYGVLPQPGPVSWEGHLSGAIIGVYAACRNH
jgi:membrane associated rhomboid family serine protease